MKTFRSVTIFLLSLALVRTGSLSGIAQQPQPSLTELHDKAEGGIAAAQYLLGHAYAAGSRVPKDEVEAAKWFRKAADQGHAGAQFRLGGMYFLGRGVPKDEVEAVKWYHKAAHQGYDLAQSALGVLYAHGEGVSKDAVAAANWFRKAADQGHAKSQHSLGLAYANGEGVSKDEVEAAKWCRRAADQGHAEAQYFIGVLYGNGEGVPKDEAQAYQWLLLASAQGNAYAKESYILLEKDLTPELRAQGQRLAREFKPKIEKREIKAPDYEAATNDKSIEVLPNPTRPNQEYADSIEGKGASRAYCTRQGVGTVIYCAADSDGNSFFLNDTTKSQGHECLSTALSSVRRKLILVLDRNHWGKEKDAGHLFLFLFLFLFRLMDAWKLLFGRLESKE